MTDEEQAELKAWRAVSLIVEDLTDRRGLRQEWEQIEDDIVREIKESWMSMIRSQILSRP